ncbi:MAG TPA: hypothetical protein V6C65_04420 [Allocoleopsis sp.]
MTCQPDFNIARPLYFSCPASVQTDLATPELWFTQVNSRNYLRLYVQPQDWTRVKQGTQSSFQKNFKSKTLKLGLQDYVFTLEVRSDDFRLRYVFEEIAEICFSSNYQRFTPVTVIDYVRPEREQFKAAIANNSEAHTVRTGMIKIEDSSGANGSGANLYGVDGFRVVFEQLKSGLV